MGRLTLEYLQKYSKQYSFIETGTYQGDTVKTADNYGFKTIHSIEIFQPLYEQCTETFKNDPHIKIWQGDSPDVLREIVPTLNKQSTFWLDAHRSGVLMTPGSEKYGACPLVDEVNAIALSPIKTHVIFADDQRLFGTPGWDYLQKDDYLNAILKINPNYVFEYLDGGFSYGKTFPADDIIVAYVPE